MGLPSPIEAGSDKGSTHNKVEDFGDSGVGFWSMAKIFVFTLLVIVFIFVLFVEV